MADYVLDENIILLAAQVWNAKKDLDVSCLALMAGIAKRCDSIHCSKTLYEKYDKKLKDLESSPQHSARSVRKILKIMLAKGAVKYKDYVPDIKEISDEKEIPEDDLFLIRLVVHTGAILVTTDCRLKDTLEKKNLTSKYNIQIQKP